MKRFGSVVILLGVVAGCGGSGQKGHSTVPTGGGSVAAAKSAPLVAANTSIATAAAISAGSGGEYQLPCDGTALFFGPFAFDKEGQAVRFTSEYRSPTGKQICGGGQWVDGSGEFIAVAGLGCPEGDGVGTAENVHTYSPGSGGPGQNPVYLKLNIAGEPPFAECVPSTLKLQRVQ